VNSINKNQKPMELNGLDKNKLSFPVNVQEILEIFKGRGYQNVAKRSGEKEKILSEARKKFS